MSVFVPLLDEVAIRAWGVPDNRVCTHLRHENQLGNGFRLRALERRARAAGWPDLNGTGTDAGRKAISQAMRRLEGMTFETKPNLDWRRIQVQYRRQTRGYHETDGTLDPILTIYDE